jgi:hypothetical protein
MSDMNLNTNDVVGMLLAVIEGSPYATEEEINMAKKLAEKATMEVESLPEEDKIEIYKVFEDTSAGPGVQEILKDTFSKENLQAAGNKAKELGTGAISRVDEFASGISDMLGVLGNKREQESGPTTKPVIGDPKRNFVSVPEEYKKEKYPQIPNFGTQRTEDENRKRLEQEKQETLRKLSQGDLMDLLGRF